MAYIKSTLTQEIEHLHTLHMLGRNNPLAHTSLDSDLTSRQHATIEWQNSTWSIQDLSRNGTWLNGEKLELYTPIELKIGDIIKFGRNNSEGLSYEVCDLDKPQNIVYRPHPSLEIVPISETNLIPSETTPDYGFYYSYDRKGWFSQMFNTDDHDTSYEEYGPHKSGDEIRCAGNRWYVFLLDEHAPTTKLREGKRQPHVDGIEFRIVFSRKEDDVLIALVSRTDDMELRRKPYTKILAELIKLQQQSEDGWVRFDDLAKHSGKNEATLNMQLFVMRNHISSKLKGFKGLSRLIERKGDLLRWGVTNFSIYRKGKLDQSSDF